MKSVVANGVQVVIEHVLCEVVNKQEEAISLTSGNGSITNGTGSISIATDVQRISRVWLRDEHGKERVMHSSMTSNCRVGHKMALIVVKYPNAAEAVAALHNIALRETEIHMTASAFENAIATTQQKGQQTRLRDIRNQAQPFFYQYPKLARPLLMMTWMVVMFSALAATSDGGAAILWLFISSFLVLKIHKDRFIGKRRNRLANKLTEQSDLMGFGTTFTLDVIPTYVRLFIQRDSNNDDANQWRRFESEGMSQHSAVVSDMIRRVATDGISQADMARFREGVVGRG